MATVMPRVSVSVDEELEARLEEFREDQTIEPAKSEVIRTALERFLDEQGY